MVMTHKILSIVVTLTNYTSLDGAFWALSAPPPIWLPKYLHAS
jgi:hypothetical protein